MWPNVVGDKLQKSMKQLVCILIAITFIACSKNETTIIKGTIKEAISGKPIEGFKISGGEDTGGLLDPSTPENPSGGTTFSDSEGNYTLVIKGSGTAETYSLWYVHEQYCGRFIQTIRADKEHTIDFQTYRSAKVDIIVQLEDAIDSVVITHDNSARYFSVGQCRECFGAYIGQGTCLEEPVFSNQMINYRRPQDDWDKWSLRFEGLQGVKYGFSYQLFNKGSLLKEEDRHFVLETDSLSVSITL